MCEMTWFDGTQYMCSLTNRPCLHPRQMKNDCLEMYQAQINEQEKIKMLAGNKFPERARVFIMKRFGGKEA